MNISFESKITAHLSSYILTYSGVLKLSQVNFLNNVKMFCKNPVFSCFLSKNVRFETSGITIPDTKILI